MPFRGSHFISCWKRNTKYDSRELLRETWLDSSNYSGGRETFLRGGRLSLEGSLCFRAVLDWSNWSAVVFFSFVFFIFSLAVTLSLFSLFCFTNSVGWMVFNFFVFLFFSFSGLSALFLASARLVPLPSPTSIAADLLCRRANSISLVYESLRNAVRSLFSACWFPLLSYSNSLVLVSCAHADLFPFLRQFFVGGRWIDRPPSDSSRASSA